MLLNQERYIKRALLSRTNSQCSQMLANIIEIKQNIYHVDLHFTKRRRAFDLVRY